MPKIVRFYETGGPEVLRLEDSPIQAPKANEVRLRIVAIALNRGESMFRRGIYLEKPVLPSRIGYEAAGIIDDVGPGVIDFKVGDRVSTIHGFSQSRFGVYGEIAVVPVDSVARYPDRLCAVEAASIWMQYITAWGGADPSRQVEIGTERSNTCG
jgi:NADPH:quinone reductase-like Zn-dependent oxidoreductase